MAATWAPHQRRLIILGRFPLPGEAKTRLIPSLGPIGAANLQKKMTEAIIKEAFKAHAVAPMTIQFCYAGGSEKAVQTWVGPGLKLAPQVEGDLGTRMQAAFTEAFQDGCQKVLIIGTDIQGVKAEHLNAAFDALGSHQAVIGPVVDGGYWGIGLACLKSIFHGVKWSTAQTLRQTLHNIRQAHLSCTFLVRLRDVDTSADLNYLDPGMETTAPYLSVIIPALNEARHIATAIGSARDRASEVIVVDGGSTDGTPRIAREEGARVMNHSHGRSAQQNYGAGLAKGEFLLFLHADTRLPNGYARHVYQATLASKFVLGAFRFNTDYDTPIMRAIVLLTNFRAAHLKLPYGDQALFCRRAVFNAMGGFPKVDIAEDLVFVRNMGKRGAVRILAKEAITSGRRWRRFGILRTTLINQIILLGCSLGISPQRFITLYRRRR